MKILFVDHTTKLGGIDDLATQARGGMVSSLFHVTNGLAERGHEVVVWSGLDDETPAGVRWVSEPEDDADAIVFNRGMADGHPELGSGRRFLWAHDLPHIGFCPNPRHMRGLACLVSMSRYADRVWRHLFDYDGKSTLIPNGVDFDLFKPRGKTPEYLIYASAPNRGLWRLPLIYDAVKNRHKGRIWCHAYSNMRTQHPNEIKETEDNYELDYSTCEEVGIRRLDPIPQHKLAVQLGQAGMLLLPTNYPEICSNIILQSLACGTPVITTGLIGSAGEWLKHRKNAMLTTYAPRDYMVYQKEIIMACVEVLGNTRLARKMQRGALRTARTQILSWDDVADRWAGMVNRYS